MNARQLASSIPRCGQKYEASYKGKSNHKNEFMDGSKKRSFDIEIDTILKLDGDKASAKMNIANTVKIKASENIPASRLNKEANVLAGDRIFQFLTDAERDDLKEADPIWAGIERAVLPTKQLDFHFAAVKYLVEFDPALPSLVTPNAALEVYKKDIGNGLLFKNIKAAITGKYTTEKDVDGKTKEVFTKFDTPITKEIDIEIKITKEDGEKITVEMSSIESGTTRSAANDYKLLSQGLIPKTTLEIDTSLRRNRVLNLKLPYKASAEYYYSNEISLLKVLD